MVYPEMQISYPIRDKILVENTIPHKHSVPLEMQPIKYNVAYLRHVEYVENIFFYRDKIPNGIIDNKTKDRHCEGDSPKQSRKNNAVIADLVRNPLVLNRDFGKINKISRIKNLGNPENLIEIVVLTFCRRLRVKPAMTNSVNGLIRHFVLRNDGEGQRPAEVKKDKSTNQQYKI